MRLTPDRTSAPDAVPATTCTSALTRENETARLEAFSDGVFAIAITLLILDLKTPAASEHGPRLEEMLLREWPAYLALVLSFAFIGIMWINHHRLFSLIRRTDHTLLLLNGMLLFGVTVIPFPTSLLAAYLGHRDQQMAAIVCSGSYLWMSILFNVLWRYASYRNRLLDPNADPVSIRAIDRAYAFGPLMYVITFFLAFVSVPACVGMLVALALFFVLPGRREVVMQAAA